MTTATVNIDSLDKIQAFVKIINEYNGRFDLVSGCSRVNAKSIMGIFSLDISRQDRKVIPCPVFLFHGKLCFL